MKTITISKHKRFLKNEEFGRWKVITFSFTKNCRDFWLCKCSCGVIRNVSGYSLVSGNSESCGCLHKEVMSKKKTKHGFFKTKFYSSYIHMKTRCDNKKHKYYKDYGGRGITYDSEWKNFIEFKNDMYIEYIKCKLKYKTKLSIERKDVNGNYYKDNCTFIPVRLQAGNTRRNKKFIALSPEGNIFTSKNVNSFSKIHKLTLNSIFMCLKDKQNHHKRWKFNYA